MMASELCLVDKGNFLKYPKIPEADLNFIPFKPNTFVEAFEKLDGGNCQIRRIGNKLYHGSRGHYIHGRDAERVGWFNNFSGWFYSNGSLYNLPENLVVFGEWLGHHTIDYDEENIDKFYLLDVFDLKSFRFIGYEKGVKKLARFGVKGFEISKPVARGKIGSLDLSDITLNQESKYYFGPKEGLVVKRYSVPQMFFKVYYPDFAETRKGRSGKVDYLTGVRFRKAYMGIIEEHGEGALSLERISETVVQNVFEEKNVYCDISEVRRKLEYYIVFGNSPSNWKVLLKKDE